MPEMSIGYLKSPLMDGSLPMGARFEHYVHMVRNTRRASLIGYWPLYDPSGSVAVDRSGSSGRNGSYTGVDLLQVGIGDGRGAPLFGGAGDYVTIQSTGLAGAFSGSAGTISVWAKVADAGVWADATLRVVMRFRVDVSNDIQVRRTTTNNQLSWLYLAGGTTKTVVSTAFGGNVGWLNLAMTWSLASDQVIAYGNGLQVGATQTGLGTWAGAPTSAYLGAASAVPASVWSGYLAHAAIWSVALSGQEVKRLARL